MAVNVGTFDRGLRIVAGLALIAFAVHDTSAWRWVGVAGPVLIVTALVRFCPAYWLLRIRTAPRPVRHTA